MPPAVTWLVRHGQSTSNAGLPAVGHGEVPLTELGHQQAREVARRVERPPTLLIVSPFLRAEATAEPIRTRWPETPVETWEIQELTYLSPARCRGTTADMRRPWAEDYWRRCDPDYRDGPDAESFRAFSGRLSDFHRRLLALDGGFAIAIGHGQFFRAYQLSLETGFAVTAETMRNYRRNETARPMANGEVIELDAETVAQVQVTN